MNLLVVPMLLLITTVAISTAGTDLSRTSASTPPNFSGIWRLNDPLSDSPTDIAARLRAERLREQTTAQLPASAASSGAAVASPAPGSRGDHGGGHAMGGGGHGRGGSHGQNKTRTSDAGAAVVDAPPPLLADDSLLNVEQDAKLLHVSLSDTDRMDARLDGVAQQSLGGNAVVRIHRDATSMAISMAFDGGTRLDETWVESPDNHRLVVTEQWTTPALRQPIIFKRSYDRLGL